MNRAVKHCAYRTGDFGRAGTFAFFMEKAAVKPYVNTLIDDNIGVTQLIRQKYLTSFILYSPYLATGGRSGNLGLM